MKLKHFRMMNFGLFILLLGNLKGMDGMDEVCVLMCVLTGV